MRINVNAGHSHKVPGAQGIISETKEARRVKDALIAELRARGHEVTDGTSELGEKFAIIREQVAKAKRAGAELAVSIHFNSFHKPATGSEVLYWWTAPNMKPMAQQISRNLSQIMGIPNRGAKTSRVNFLRDTPMKALLVEVCFVQDKRDVEAYGRVGVEAVAKAIADGIEAKSTAAGNTAAIPAPSAGAKDFEKLVADTIAGAYGNGEDRRKALGDNFAAVQAEVNRRLLGKPAAPVSTPASNPAPAAPAAKSIETMKQEVIRGLHGNGHASRQRSLGVSDAVYSKVKDAVNAHYGVTSKAAPRASSQRSLDNVATRVIRGEYGNGSARVAKLKREGWDVRAVQKRVNELLR